jgi:hypothetical protein
VRRWEWAAGLCGLVLLVAMFLDWYGSSNAWQALTVIDVFLAIAALFGIAIFVSAATQRSPAMTQGLGSLTVIAGFVASVLVILRVLDLPGSESREIGLWIGLVATLGVLMSAWRSIGDERFPRAAVPEVEITPLPAPKPRTEPQDD